MKKFFTIFLFQAILFLISSCSSDDSAYNPYTHREKSPFYPREIRIEKQSGKIDISEIWTFEYNTQNAITAYTHETVTKLEKKEGTETTTKIETGKLRYYPNGDISNDIALETKIDGILSNIQYKEEIDEDIQCNDGRITNIKRQIKKFNEKGEETYTVTNRTFNYTGDHCTSSTFTDEYNSAGPITHTYTYYWDGSHKLTGVEIDEKEEESRVYKIFKYEYDKLSKDRVFQTNAFIHEQFPQIYAAMGYFGEDCPYEIHLEEQNFKIFINGTWDKDNSSDSKTFTLLENNANELKYDISSNIYSTNYYVKFIK